MSKNLGHVDHVVVIRTQGALLDLKTAVEDAFSECGSWIDRLLDTGEIKPPATLRFIDSNAQCLGEGLIDKDVRQKPEYRHHRLEKIDSPLFAVLEDSQGKKFTLRIELDCERTS